MEYLVGIYARLSVEHGNAKDNSIQNQIRLAKQWLEEQNAKLAQKKIRCESLSEKQKEEEILKRHLGENTIVTSVYAYNENILQFYCGGSGFLDTGTYTGFYFSRDDKPYAFEFNNLKLVEISPGVFEGQDENGVQQRHGGHRIRTEKIRDKWYYYIQYWY